MDTSVKSPTIAQRLLTAARERRTPIAVFLRNGYQIHGVVDDFDAEVVVFHVDDKRLVVFHQAISTIDVDAEFRF